MFNAIQVHHTFRTPTVAWLILGVLLIDCTFGMLNYFKGNR